MTLPEYKLGWVAGVFDYKATPIRKGGKNRAGGRQQLSLLVESKNLAVTNELCALTGTEPDNSEQRPRKDWMRRGCVTHCPAPDVEYPGERDTLPAMGKWTVSGAAAIVVLRAVQPFMVTDRGITDMITQCEAQLVTSGRGVGNVRKSIERLKGLGWPMPEGLEARIAAPVPEVAARQHRTAAQAGLA